MIIEFEGQTWDVDPEKINVDEWRELKRKYKMTPAQWEEGIKEADPDAATFFYWIMLRRSGNQMASLGDHLKPDILALNDALFKAQQAEEKQTPPEPEPEPPVPPTSRPASAASPVPGSPTTTTPPPMTPVHLGLNGSGQATSTHSAPNTWVPSPPSATSTNQTSASSP